MSTEQIPHVAEVGRVKHLAVHPLSPLAASEIVRAADFIRNLYPASVKLQFKAVTLEEPEKARLAPYLDAEHGGRRLPSIDRKAFVSYYIRNTVSPWEAVVWSSVIPNMALAERVCLG